MWRFGGVSSKPTVSGQMKFIMACYSNGSHPSIGDFALVAAVQSWRDLSTSCSLPRPFTSCFSPGVVLTKGMKKLVVTPGLKLGREESRQKVAFHGFMAVWTWSRSA